MTKDPYGPIGKRRTASLYTRVRLKRHIKRANRIGRIYIKRSKFEVQKKVDDKWILIGTFGNEDEAVDFLYEEVKRMEKAEKQKGTYD